MNSPEVYFKWPAVVLLQSSNFGDFPHRKHSILFPPFDSLVSFVCNSNSLNLSSVFGKFWCLSLPGSVDLFTIFSCGSCFPDEVHNRGASVSGTLGDLCLKTIFTRLTGPFWNMSWRWITLTDNEVHKALWNISNSFFSSKPKAGAFLRGHFGKYHNTPCLSTQILNKHCLCFLLGPL